ncbi:toxin-antitoxin system YwqK family antitoxin [Pedobacter caeni]|nr:hypothetical protein [Pedobacter caeni]
MRIKISAVNVLKKILILFSFFAGAKNLQAQENIKIGNLLEIYNQDSLKVYLNSVGRIVNEKKAKFVRIGKRDPVFMNVVSNFIDYDLKGNVIFKGTMSNNYLNGSAVYFHNSGKISEEGNYKDDVRVGVWKYYYPDGKLSKVLEFENGIMTIKEAYSKKGAVEVIDGNGKTFLFVSYFRQVIPYEASGTVKNGKMNGKWRLHSSETNRDITTETFENGLFIKGEDVSYVNGSQSYNDYPRIVLNRFYPNEAVDFSHGEDALSDKNSIKLWEYKGALGPGNIYKLLLASINGKYKFPLADQWVIMGFKINENDSISHINISSSIHDETFNKYLYHIFAKSSGWKSAEVNDKKIATDVIFSLIVKEKKIVLPAFLIDYRMQKLQKTWEFALPEIPAYDSNPE